ERAPEGGVGGGRGRSLISRTNSSSVKRARAFASLSGRRTRSSSCTGTGRSSWSWMSLRARRTTSRLASAFSRSLGFLIWPARDSTPSSVPNSSSSAAAVFSPTPGMPGTLSILSPVRASRSATRCGGAAERSVGRMGGGGGGGPAGGGGGGGRGGGGGEGGAAAPPTERGAAWPSYRGPRRRRGQGGRGDSARKAQPRSGRGGAQQR